MASAERLIYLSRNNFRADVSLRSAVSEWCTWLIHRASIIVPLAGGSAFGLMATPGYAANVTWSGGGASADWFQAGNWIRLPPSPH